MAFWHFVGHFGHFGIRHRHDSLGLKLTALLKQLDILTLDGLHGFFKRPFWLSLRRSRFHDQPNATRAVVAIMVTPDAGNVSLGLPNTQTDRQTDNRDAFVCVCERYLNMHLAAEDLCICRDTSVWSLCLRVFVDCGIGAFGSCAFVGL